MQRSLGVLAAGALALLAQNANTNTLPLTKPWLQGFRTFI